MLEFDETFTVIGDDGRRELVEMGTDGGASLGTFDEVLYEAVSDDSWDKGEEVGRARGMFIQTPDGHAIVVLTLHLDGGDGSMDSLTAQGALPRHGDGVGEGVLSVAGGTGRFKNRTGQLYVEVMNPHKYRFVS